MNHSLAICVVIVYGVLSQNLSYHFNNSVRNCGVRNDKGSPCNQPCENEIEYKMYLG